MTPVEGQEPMAFSFNVLGKIHRHSLSEGLCDNDLFINYRKLLCLGLTIGIIESLEESLPRSVGWGIFRILPGLYPQMPGVLYPQTFA